MSKVAIVTDSNSGITQSEAKEYGVTVMPMPFFINDQTYYEDIDLTQEDFYQKLSEDANISTSMPLVGNVTDTWDALLQDYDEIVHIPMSSGLSGSCETAIMLSQDYDGRVQVVNNQRISVTQRQSVLDAKALAEKGYSAEAIKEILEREKMESSIYIMVDTLYYLKKGGRITPAAAALGTLLKLKPVLQIQGEKLDSFAKARTVKQAKKMMIDAMRAHGLAEPLFCPGFDRFKVVLYRSKIEPVDHGGGLIVTALKHCDELGTRELAERTGLTISQVRSRVNALIAQGELEPTAPATSRNRKYRLTERAEQMR